MRVGVRTRTIGFTIAALVCGLAVGLYPTVAAKAQPPLVVIAYDATSQANCHLLRSSPTSSTTETPCPLGTIVSTQIVTKQAALAMRQPFVVLPDKNASQAVLTATQAQINTLLDQETSLTLSVAKAFKTSSQAVSPLSIGCGNTTTVGVNGNLNFNSGTVVFGSVNYYLDPSCAYVTLNVAYARVVSPAGSHPYWEYTAYAAGHWGFPCDGNVFNTCPVIGSATASQGIHSTHNAGYWFQEQFCSGSHCSPFDAWARVNFVILN